VPLPNSRAGCCCCCAAAGRASDAGLRRSCGSGCCKGAGASGWPGGGACWSCWSCCCCCCCCCCSALLRRRVGDGSGERSPLYDMASRLTAASPSGPMPWMASSCPSARLLSSPSPDSSWPLSLCGQKRGWGWGWLGVGRGAGVVGRRCWRCGCWWGARAIAWPARQQLQARTCCPARCAVAAAAAALRWQASSAALRRATTAVCCRVCEA
jgi:hypothetical protein